MAAHLKSLSDGFNQEIPTASGYRFGIVVADWNSEITKKLEEGALNFLKSNDAKEEDVLVNHVPGSIEITLGAQFMAEYQELDAVICLGCVIQGETRHFDYVCDSVTQGITQLNIKYNIPFIYGILTTDNLEQARDRAGGKHGNKGEEAAGAAIRMAHLKKKLKNS
ncbi:MAG: 6,7-dimethyl-8-ribityllumazine synthase [Bacteroidales bacterium]